MLIVIFVIIIAGIFTWIYRFRRPEIKVKSTYELQDSILKAKNKQLEDRILILNSKNDSLQSIKPLIEIKYKKEYEKITRLNANSIVREFKYILAADSSN
jgi:hypothetical protein